MKKIVLGYDDSEASQRALERAAQLAKAFGSELVVTSVAPIMTSIGRSGGPIDPTDPPAKHAEELAQARAYLEGQGVSAEYQSAVGNPADTIAAAGAGARRRPDRRRHPRAERARSACSARASARRSRTRRTATC